MAKMVEEKQATTTVRGFVLFAFIVSASIIFLGSGLNDLNLKYSRVTSKSNRTCRRELFILTVPNSQLCCDSPFNADDWVCVASFDTLNRIFSSKWAFQIPLIPLVLTMVTELVSSVLLADSTFATRLESHGCRLFLYICMILLRTVCCISVRQVFLIHSSQNLFSSALFSLDSAVCLIRRRRIFTRRTAENNEAG